MRAELTAPTSQGYGVEQCQPVGTVVGKGGGSFGGAWIANEQLVEYALNDLRNKAAARGANFVHYAAPQFGTSGGSSGSNVSSAMITGTAYRCEGAPSAVASAAAGSYGSSNAGIRSSRTRDGHKNIMVNLQFESYSMHLSFSSATPGTVWWEITVPQGTFPAQPECGAVVVIDGKASSYEFAKPTTNRPRTYFQLPLAALDEISNAQRVTGRMCKLDWRWSAQQLAQAKEFALQVKEELAILDSLAPKAAPQPSP